MRLGGNIWKYGHRLSATDIVPSEYDTFGMSHDWASCAKHLLMHKDPDFVTSQRPGDLIIAGEQLGSGHAHYHMAAIMACKTAGVSALLSDSVSALFQRAGIDQGYPIWAFPGISELVENGDHLEIDLATGKADNRTSGLSVTFKPVSPLILDILAAGGSLDWAINRAAAAP